MADKKITELTNITGANLVDADEFVVVDISADETKAITLGELKEAFDAGSGFVRITGDTMTGPLDVQSTITSDGLTVDATSAISLASNKTVTTPHTDYNLLLDNDSDTQFVIRLDSVFSGSIGSSHIKQISEGSNRGALVFATESGSGGVVPDRLKINYNGDISFYEDTGTTPKFFWDASAEGLNLGATSVPFGKLDVSDVGGSGVSTIFDTGANGDNYFTAGTSGIQVFRTGSTERMRIDSSGNVGIGTSDPVENLTVGATTTAAGFSLGSATTQAYLRYNNYFSGTSQVSDATKGSASISLGRSSDGVITFNTAAAGAGIPAEAMRINSSGNVGIGTSSPSSDISGTTTVLHIRNGNLPSLRLDHSAAKSYEIYSGGSGELAFTADGTERMRIDSSGRVGIGTSSPDYRLEVEEVGTGSGLGGIAASTATAGGNAGYRWATGGTTRFGMTLIGSAGSESLRIYDSNNSSERMRIDSSGNVGIGTSSPSESLHLRNTLGGENGAILIEAFAPNIKFNDLSSPVSDYQILVNNSFNIKRDAAGDGTFEATDLTIDSSGNVGIGTSSPDQVLHVEKSVAGGGVELLVGNSGANQSGTYSQVGLGTGGDSTGTAYFRLYRDGSGISELGGYTNQTFLTNGSERMRIDSSGRVGIGTSSPSDELEIASSSPAIRLTDTNDSTYGAVSYNVGALFLNGDQTIRFNTDGAEAMRIDSSGNVGIGTSSPAQKLHVNVGGTSSAIKYLQIDGAGNSGSVTGQMGIGFRPIAAGSNVHASIEALENLSGSWKTNLLFKTNGVESDSAPIEAMRIDSSGNLLVGVTSPQDPLSTTTNGHTLYGNGVDVAIHSRNNANPLAVQRTGNDGEIINVFKDTAKVGSIGHNGNIYLAGTSSGIRVRANDVIPATETGVANDNALDLGISTARFKDLYLSNDVFVNKTTKVASSDDGIVLSGAGFAYIVRSSGVQLLLGNLDSGGASEEAIRFVRNGSDVGSIDTTGSATSYNTSSDYRLKTDAQPMTGATDRLKQLNPVNFEWIADGTRVDGFLAHEAQAVVPESVTGAKDAMCDEEYEVTPAVTDDDGNVITEAVMGTRSVPDYQGIDQSKLVPLLVATIKELEARITALENA